MKEYLYYYFDPKNQLITGLPLINSNNVDNTVIHITDIDSLLTLMHNARTQSTLLFDQSGLAEIEDNFSEIRRMRQVHTLYVNGISNNYLSVTPANWQVISLLAQGTVIDPTVDLTKVTIFYPHKDNKNNKDKERNDTVNKPIDTKKSNATNNPKVKVEQADKQIITASENSDTTKETISKTETTAKPKVSKKTTKKQTSQKAAKNKPNPNIAVELPKAKPVASDNEPKTDTPKAEKVTTAQPKVTDKVAQTESETKADSVPKAKIVENQTATIEPASQPIVFGNNDEPAGNETTATLPDELDNKPKDVEITATDSQPANTPETITFSNNSEASEPAQVNFTNNDQVTTSGVPDSTVSEPETDPQSTVFSNNGIKTPSASSNTETADVTPESTPINDDDFLAQMVNSKPKPKSDPKPVEPAEEDNGNSSLEDAMKEMKF